MQRETEVIEVAARIIERDPEQRQRLIDVYSVREEAGQDPAIDDAGGFQWKPWALDFARRNPGLAALAPISAICWLLLIGDWLARAAHALLRMLGG